MSSKRKQPQHVISLEVENFMRVKAFKLAPGRKHVKIGGKNGHGKSGVLDAVKAGLGGKKGWPKNAVRHDGKGNPIEGVDEARILLKTDEWIISVVGDNEKQKIKITDHDGEKLTGVSTAALLADIYETLTADPIAYMHKSDADQLAILRKVIGLDLEKEIAARDKAYKERTIVGRDVKRLEGALKTVPSAPDDTPDEETSGEEASAILDSAMTKQREITKAEGDLDALRRLADEASQRVSTLRTRLAEAEESLAGFNTQGVRDKEAFDAMVAPDVDAAQAKVRDLEVVNAAVRKKQERATILAELTGYREEYDGFTKRVDEIDQLMTDATEKAVYPIDGLRVSDEGVMYNGSPLRDASDAEKIRVSSAISLALNPEVSVLLVRMGSLLDEDSERALYAAADEAGAQVWFEVVSSDSKGVTVFIEDGEIAA